MKFAMSILIIILLTFSCHPPPGSGTTYKQLTVTATGFMHDCKAGDEINGISANDVNYTAKISVYTNTSGSNYSLSDGPYTIPTPSAPDRSTFTKQVTVPANKASRIIVTVDAFECSACNYSFGCNPITTFSGGNVYKENIGKPYWRYENSFAPSALGATLTVMPFPYPRNPNAPSVCTCKIKI